MVKSHLNLTRVYPPPQVFSARLTTRGKHQWKWHGTPAASAPIYMEVRIKAQRRACSRPYDMSAVLRTSIPPAWQGTTPALVSSGPNIINPVVLSPAHGRNNCLPGSMCFYVLLFGLEVLTLACATTEERESIPCLAAKPSPSRLLA